MRPAIQQATGRLLPPVGSSPDSLRGLGVIAWAHDRIVQIEQLVTDLEGLTMTDVLVDRYERALTRGHSDNLRRLRHRKED